MPKWRRNSEFGTGRRVPLDREQRAQILAKLKLARRPGGLTIAAAEIGRILVGMMGVDGQLDPSIATIATRAAVDPSTVTRALAQLKALGFLDWTRRLVRTSSTGWRVAQASNAYVLRVPASNVHFAQRVILVRLKKEAYRTEPTESPYESAARQLRAIGHPVPVAWGV